MLGAVAMAHPGARLPAGRGCSARRALTGPGWGASPRRSAPRPTLNNIICHAEALSGGQEAAAAAATMAPSNGGAAAAVAPAAGAAPDAAPLVQRRRYRISTPGVPVGLDERPALDSGSTGSQAPAPADSRQAQAFFAQPWQARPGPRGAAQNAYPYPYPPPQQTWQTPGNSQPYPYAYPYPYVPPPAQQQQPAYGAVYYGGPAAVQPPFAPPVNAYGGMPLPQPTRGYGYGYGYRPQQQLQVPYVRTYVAQGGGAQPSVAMPAGEGGSLERVSPAGGANYLQVVGYVDGVPVPVSDNYTTLTLAVPYKQKEGAMRFPVEAFYAVAGPAASLAPGTEVVISGGVRASQQSGGCAIRADLLQVVDRASAQDGLPPPGFRGTPRGQGPPQLERVAVPAVQNTVKLIGKLQPGTPPQGGAVAATATVFVPYSSKPGGTDVAVEAWREMVPGLVSLLPGTEVAIGGRLRMQADGSMVVTVSRLQIVDRTDSALPPAGPRPRAAAPGQPGAALSDRPAREAKPPLDAAAVYSAHYEGGQQLQQIAFGMRRDRREVLLALLKHAEDTGQPLRWRKLAEEMGLAMVSNDPVVPYPTLYDLMCVFHEYRNRAPDPGQLPRTKDGELRLKPVHDMVLALAAEGLESNRELAKRFEAYERDRGGNDAYASLRLADYADRSEFKLWKYGEEFPEDTEVLLELAASDGTEAA